MPLLPTQRNKISANPEGEEGRGNRFVLNKFHVRKQVWQQLN